MKSNKIFLVAFFLFLISPQLSHAAHYRSELNDVTRGGRIYDFTLWDAKLDWKATLFTDAFRREQAKLHAKLYKLNDIDASAHLASEEKKQATGWEFFVSFYTKKPYKEFSLSPSSFWFIQLTTTTGEVIKPVSIEMMQITPYVAELYPYLSRWSKAYRVVFPKVHLGKKPSLMLWSVVGESSATWSLADTRE